jgi:histidyl-tRNA synthetase
MNSIGTESYKGVRDFYPEEMYVQKYIFNTMRDVVEKYGYVEYGASVLEPTELYKAKSGEEIVNEQTYSFKDRGDRDVTLRPEMTPTVARMVAAKKRELAFPLRWYSIPNLFRYEKPQRGRLREHWQLNVDVFGINTIHAEVEILTIASRIMEAFGATAKDFEIRINHRKVLDYILQQVYKLNEKDAHTLTKLIDRKNKMEPSEFLKGVREILDDQSEAFIHVMTIRNPEDLRQKIADDYSMEIAHLDEVTHLQKQLNTLGINTIFDPALARGFDYYTGIVFEVNDTHQDNRRSLFGGGRYDDLLSVFGSEKVPAMGFGMGDVTIKDFLEIRGLIPAYKASAEILVACFDENQSDHAHELAEKLRSNGVHVVTDFTNKKIGDKIKNTTKQHIPFILIIGEDEIQSKLYTLKNLDKASEEKISFEELVSRFGKK